MTLNLDTDIEYNNKRQEIEDMIDNIIDSMNFNITKNVTNILANEKKKHYR